MRLGSLLASLALATTVACGGAPGASTTPATTGVRAYAAALRSDDARAAYDLLTDDVKHTLTYDDFATQWKASAAERAWQAKALDDGLRDSPDLAERAAFTLTTGTVVPMEREGKAWHLGASLVRLARAGTARDALHLFADAVGDRDLEAVLALLTARRRDGLSKQIHGFVDGFAKHLVHAGPDDHLVKQGEDRFTYTWVEADLSYVITLRKEADEWRIDDVDVGPAPTHGHRRRPD